MQYIIRQITYTIIRVYYTNIYQRDIPYNARGFVSIENELGAVFSQFTPEFLGAIEVRGLTNTLRESVLNDIYLFRISSMQPSKEAQTILSPLVEPARSVLMVHSGEFGSFGREMFPDPGYTLSVSILIST